MIKSKSSLISHSDDLIFTEAQYDCWENVFSILDKGWHVDSLSKDNKTLLHYALEHHNQQAFLHLIKEYGADLQFALDRQLNPYTTFKWLFSSNPTSEWLYASNANRFELEKICKTLTKMTISPNSGLARMHEDYPNSQLDPIYKPTPKLGR